MSPLCFPTCHHLVFKIFFFLQSTVGEKCMPDLVQYIENAQARPTIKKHYENLSLELNQPSNTGRCGWQTRIC